MHTFFPSFRVVVLALYTLIQMILYAPCSAIPSPTNIQLSTPRHVSPRITLQHFNTTYHMENSEIKYHVPDTQTTIYFDLGFSCEEEGMRKTIISARSYCEQHLEQKGDGPLPRSEDPFHEDLGYGAAITVVSVRLDHRLTWSILKETMDGLWDVLVTKSYYTESTIHIHHGTWGLVGRGTIIEVPETKSARQSRKRQAIGSLGSTFS